MDFLKLLEKARFIEEEGRRLASQRDEKVSEADIYFFRKIIDFFVEKMRYMDSSSFYFLAEKGEGSTIEDLTSFSFTLGKAAQVVERDARSCMLQGLARKECIIDIDTLEEIDKVDEHAEEIFGKRCTWLRGEVAPYTLSAAINDITACFHRLLDRLESLLGDVESVDRMCVFHKPSSDIVKKACRRWMSMVDEFANHDLYYEEDYNSLMCKTRDNVMECRVGSSSGHAAHIDFDKGVIEYYDTDDAVNEAVKRLLEEAGLKCEKDEEGVKCKGLRKDNYKKAMDVMATVTSMDLRMSNPCDFWNVSLTPEEEIRRVKELLRVREEWE